MEEFNPIEFHQTRNFGKKINITFEFIKQNFKSLGKSILFIAGPAVLIGSLFIGSFFSEFLALALKQPGNNQEALKYFASYSFWVEMALMYVLLIVSYVITLATINSYAFIYYHKKTNQIQVSEVWEKVRETTWKYLGSFMLILLSLIALVIVVTVIGIVLQKISGLVLAVLIIAAVVGFIYLAVGVSLLFFIQVHEGLGFFEAAARSLRLVAGKWWSTLGISMILSMIGGAISYIFMIPLYIFMVMNMLNNVSTGHAMEMSPTFKTVTLIFLTLYYMAQMLLQSLPNIGLIFQYFNLVEMKEAKGLMSDIENFGKPSPEPPREESF